MGAARDLHEVILVEDAPPPGAGPAVPAAPPDERRGPWSRPGPSRRAWRAAVVGVLLAALTVTLVAQSRERSHLAELAEVPGVLAQVDGPLTPLWSADTGTGEAVSSFGGRVLSVLEQADGSVDAVALDRRTGRQVWRTRVRAAGAVVAALPGKVANDPSTSGGEVSAGPLSGSCATPAGEPPASDPGGVRVFACVVVDAIAATSESLNGTTVAPTRARLVLIDAATGALVSDHPTSPTTTVATLGSDLVVASIDEQGRAVVRRTDPTAAAPRWTFTSERPAAAAAGTARAARNTSWISVSGDVVAVSVWDGVGSTGSTHWLLDGAGHELELPAGSGDRVAIDATSSGRRVVAMSTTAADGFATTITDLASGHSVTTPTYPSDLSLDDGSLPDLVLTEPAARDRIVAVDLATGRERWSARIGTDSRGISSVIVIEGRVLASGADRLQCLDGATGDVLWSVPVRPAEPSPLVTDGRAVLLIEQSAAGGAELAAYDASDGRALWTTPVADSPVLVVLDGALYGAIYKNDKAEVVAFGSTS